MLREIKTQEEFDKLTSDERDMIVCCPHCGRVYIVDLDETEVSNMFQWEDRKMLIQDALPNRTVYERELIRYYWSYSPMIKCCEECNGMF